MRIRPSLIVIVALCSSHCLAAFDAEQAPKTFSEAFDRGLYKEADTLARAAIAGPASNADFRSVEVRAHYFDAIRNDVSWGRWRESASLLNTVEQEMRKVVPENNSDWIELKIRAMDYYGQISEFSRSDRAYLDGRRIAAAAKLEATDDFDRLVQSQIDSLTEQQRWWEATLLIHERIAWLQKHRHDDALEIGNMYVALGSLSTNPYRVSALEDAFKKAQKALETAYFERKPSHVKAARAMALWAFENVHTRDYKKWDECKLREEWIHAAEVEYGADSALVIEPLTETASNCEGEISAERREQMFDRALSIAHESVGAMDSEVLYVLESQGTYYASREDSEGKNELGERILKAADALRKRFYSDAPLTLAVNELYKLADDEQYECAKSWTEVCKPKIDSLLKTLTASWGESHPALAALRYYVANRLGGLSSVSETDAEDDARYAFAEQQFQLALYNMSNTLGVDHPQSGFIAVEYANFLETKESDSPVDSKRLLSQALKAFTKHFGAKDSATVAVREDLNRMQ